MAVCGVVIVVCFLVNAISSQEANTCNQALGMESGAIYDGQIMASSSLNELRSPRYARLHRRDGGGGWTADSSDQMAVPSLTIDLQHEARIVAVATQGRYGSNEYVSSYKLAYSMNGGDWLFVLDGTNEKVFTGNSNSDNVVKIVLPEALEARYIRFMPEESNVAASMRVEVYGCLTDVYSATFDGSNYIKWDLSVPKDELHLEEELIQFWFLTSEPTGIILSAYGTQRDFILLSLVDGKLQLDINLGSNSLNDGVTKLTLGSLLDDSHWHFARYSRVGHHITLYVDNLKVKGSTNGDFSRLDLNREMTVGGASSVAKQLYHLDQNYMGCLQDVRISNTVQLSALGIALDIIKEAVLAGRSAFSVIGSLNQGCNSADMTSITFPTPESYLKWQVIGSYNNFTVHVRFRTFDDNTLILYNAMTSGGFIALGLRESVFVVVLKIGSLSEPIDIPSEYGLNDGLWHRVRVEIAGGQVKLTVNDKTEILSRNTDFVQTSTDFYIGGSPSDDTASLPGFQGCISNLYLPNLHVNFMSLETGAPPAGVNLNGIQVDTCALQDWCSPDPCEHGGVCSSDWDTFVCDCTGTGYGGAVCHTTTYNQLCVPGNIQQTIDIDGSGPLDSMTVQCDIQTDKWTQISHDTEMSMPVNGYEAPGSYVRRVVYEASWDQIDALVAASEECRQHVKYTCTNAKLLNSPDGSPYGWWMSRHDQKIVSWGGAAPGTRRCACSVMGQCSPDSTKWCNCDADVTTNAVDQGYLTEKAYLPVSQLRFGNTGAAGSSASYMLGKLMCRGDVGLQNVVSFVALEAHLAVPVSTTPGGAIDIAFQFKTTVDPTASNAAVFVAANAEGDGLIEIKLINNRTVQLQFDYGADMKTVTSTAHNALNDDEWHIVEANFDRKAVWLNVDKSGQERETLMRPELTLELTSPLYVGSSTVQSDGFVGCMRKLMVNGELVDMAEMAQSARDVLPGCIGQCSVKPCLNDGICEEKYDTVDCQCDNTAFGGDYCSVEVGVDMSSGSLISYTVPVILKHEGTVDTIDLAFKTSQAGGLLFRVDNTQDGSYIDLSINSAGNVVLKVKLLSSATEQVTTENKNFADDRNHFVYVRRNSATITLQVDDYVSRKLNGLSKETFTPGKIYIGNSESGDNSFVGCISRIQYNTIYPLKLYFKTVRPAGLTETGFIRGSRCGITEQTPMFLPPEDYPTTQSPVTTPQGVSAAPIVSDLAAGDKAAIGIVVILLLLALFLLLFLVGRYTSRHKGMYSTNEDRGAEHARTADDAVALQGSKRSKEYYM